MVSNNPKYDVAISFLSRDEPVAAAIYQKLSEGLNVFFYPRKQEELAGTDGLESMRKPFFDDSRVVVVLYRVPWGGTPWTRVEETALKEGCLTHGWQRLFFVALDSTSPLPAWLPQTHIRFNFADFGLEQAIGAIKARVQENGGKVAAMTAVRRAELLKSAEKLRQDKMRMSTDDGRKNILRAVSELFKAIHNQCVDITSKGFLPIECRYDLTEGAVVQQCVLRSNGIGMNISWIQKYSNSLDGSNLYVREFEGYLLLPGEGGILFDKPLLLEENEYSPDLSLTREYGWTRVGRNEFISSHTLAEKCVIQFLELVERIAEDRMKE